MAKTFLQVINSVHARLRAAAAATLTADADTVILGAFVNQAKEQIETEFKWHALRRTISFTGVGGTAVYDTSLLATVTSDPLVTNERSVLLFDSETDMPLFWDVTVSGPFRMNVWSRDGVTNYIRTSPSNQNVSESPGVVAVYQSGVGLTVLFADTPASSGRLYTFEAYCPQDELTASGDVILTPWQPIRDLACAIACEERGDIYGAPAQRFYDFYADSLAQAQAANKDSLYDDAMKVV
jgi:hypothetical protein